MNTIFLQEPGLLTTIQDLGRFGYGPMGVSASGAADPIALRLGNRLVGNHENAPALEMTMRGGLFVFEQEAVVALAGAYVEDTVPMWTSVRVRGSLRVGPVSSGARCYLCVRGGIDVPRVLGSASTHVRSGLGGAVLSRGASLSIGSTIEGRAYERVRRSALEMLAPRKFLRVTPGPQFAEFEQPDVLFDREFVVTPQTDRMGVRLSGSPLRPPHGGTMLTEGVSLGAVQVPANGQPIVLFVDAQTTGGYPLVANVIAADLASVGQLRPGDRVRFSLVTFEEAREAYFEQERLLRSQQVFW